MSRTLRGIGLAGLAMTMWLAGTARGVASEPLFAAHETLAVTLEAPWKKIVRDRKGEPEYHEAILELAGDVSRRLEIRIRTRGKFRRQRKTCRFPPLKLNLRKKQTEGTVFEGQDKLKLVTHCRDNDRYTQYLLKEYLAYRMLNRLTDASFRVRLLDIRYLDPEKPDRVEQHYGFLIEDESALGERIGAVADEVVEVPRASLDIDHSTLMTMFQYLLGNTDWSFIAGPEGDNCCHNSVPFRRGDGTYLPVPYDFDFSGFVDPPYADPPEQFKLKNVRQRLYRGPCAPAVLIDRAAERFLEAEADLLTLIREQQGLQEQVRQDTLGYVGEFYATLRDPAAMQEAFFARCGRASLR